MRRALEQHLAKSRQPGHIHSGAVHRPTQVSYLPEDLEHGAGLVPAGDDRRIGPRGAEHDVPDEARELMLVMLLGQTRVFYSMSRDGLLPKWASAIHPKFRTPWITTIVFGSFAAIMPAFLPIDKLSELVNIGTLLAFTIVCAGVWILRVRHPHMERPFKTPLVPLVPILGMGTALYLMTRLSMVTWTVMLIWLVVGLFIYFGYSIKRSKVQALPIAEEGD